MNLVSPPGGLLIAAAEARAKHFGMDSNATTCAPAKAKGTRLWHPERVLGGAEPGDESTKVAKALNLPMATVIDACRASSETLPSGGLRNGANTTA